MRLWSLFSHALAVIAVASACTTYVRVGSELYDDGRYVEAAEVFERTEHRLHHATPRERAEYGLFRGLTHLALGDYAIAHRWLKFSAEEEAERPGTLRSRQRALLDRAWFELGQRNRTVPVDTARALAARPPAARPLAPSTDAQHGFVPR